MDSVQGSWIPWKVIDNSHKGPPIQSRCGTCHKDTTDNCFSQSRPEFCKVSHGDCPWDYSGYE